MKFLLIVLPLFSLLAVRAAIEQSFNQADLNAREELCPWASLYLLIFYHSALRILN